MRNYAYAFSSRKNSLVQYEKHTVEETVFRDKIALASIEPLLCSEPGSFLYVVNTNVPTQSHYIRSTYKLEAICRPILVSSWCETYNRKAFVRACLYRAALAGRVQKDLAYDTMKYLDCGGKPDGLYPFAVEAVSDAKAMQEFCASVGQYYRILEKAFNRTILKGFDL